MAKSVYQKMKQFYADTLWYRQGTVARVLTMGYPWQASFHMTGNHQPFRVGYTNLTFYVKNDFADVYISQQSMRTVAGFYVQKQLRQPRFIHNLYSTWKKEAKDFRVCLGALEKIDLGSLKEKELLKYWQDFSGRYKQLWQGMIFIDAFDFMGDAVLAQALSRSKIELSAGQMHLLTTSPNYSYLQSERLDLLGLADYAQKRPALTQVIKKRVSLKEVKQKFPAFWRYLAKHVALYHWLQNDYMVVRRLDERYFLAKIRSLLVDRAEQKQERQDLADVRKLKLKQKRLARQLALPVDLVAVIDFLVVLSEWRDARKAHSQMANVIARQFSQAFSARLKVPVRVVEYLFWWEATKLFSPAQARLVSLARKRLKESIFTGNPEAGFTVFYGLKARGLHEVLKKTIAQGELRGRSAFPGVVRGQVRLIRDQRDFWKMKRNNILVAPNTRPEYVPVMKLAGAIVTEEGGLTCHAAIVSRELKKPCVVGVQGVMTTLKDGDKVEVDTEKGTVRKIK